MSDISSLIDSMANYDSITIQTQDIRQQLVTKLLPEIVKADLSVTKLTDPELYAAQSKMLSEMRGLLTDMDTAARNHTSIKLKKTETEINANIAFSAADFLSQIKLNQGNIFDTGSHVAQSKEEIDALIEKQFEDNGSIVLDSELESGELQLPSQNEDKL